MFVNNPGGRNRFLPNVGTAAAAFGALLATGPAMADIKPFQTGFQEAASPVMEQIEAFHNELFWIITGVSVLVLVLLAIVIWKFRATANPVPSKVHHNTLLEIAWTIIPVIILVVIAIPSFKLLYFEAAIPKPDVTIRAIGKQWFWTYEYPGQAANFTFDSLHLEDAAAAKAGKPRLLGVDNPLYVPVNKVIEIETAGADVIHSWAMPQMGVKMDAVPGRINHTWFKATKEGVYYGECSELCGASHAFMPIELHVVSDADYAVWLSASKKKFTALADNAGDAVTHLASK
ncbi:MAG: cytochrome c oxidase subunit II [Alphaproteobacteria bacterium]|nr:cytochrome c oxidase subunit II [Alphaproteobacteria bacterium]